MKKYSILSIIAIIFFAIPANCTNFSDLPLNQIKEFINFYKDNENVTSNYRLIEALCRQEDEQASKILHIFKVFNPENSSQQRSISKIRKMFLKLANNEFYYIQDIFLYQIKTGKQFDLNFFHNLSVRSALNAIRLNIDDPCRIPKYIQTLLKKITAFQQEIITSDQKLISFKKLKQNKQKYAGLIHRLENEKKYILIPLEKPEYFSSFYEIVVTCYSKKFIKRFNFFDHYEFMQYLLFLSFQNKRPNEFYSKGPFNLSRLTADLTKPDRSKPIYLSTMAFFTLSKKQTTIPYHGKPLEYLAQIAYNPIEPDKLPEEVKSTFRYLSRKYNSKTGTFDGTVSKEIFQNRLYVLVHMNDQDFFQQYRSIKNNQLFFDFADSKLSLSEIKNILRQKYTLPGGSITLPRYELLGYMRTEFNAETSKIKILQHIPELVHVEFIRPLITAIFSKLTKAEKRKISSQRVTEIAQKFDSPVGKVGDRTMYAEFLSIFGRNLWNAAVKLSATINIPEIDVFKWIMILLTIESRGNMFAVSPTGALGPFQHTYYFYFNTLPATIPFDPKKSALKTIKQFGIYYKKYRSVDKAIVCYHDGPGVMKIANQYTGWQQHISPAAKKYIIRFKKLFAVVKNAKNYKEVITMMTDYVF